MTFARSSASSSPAWRAMAGPRRPLGSARIARMNAPPSERFVTKSERNTVGAAAVGGRDDGGPCVPSALATSPRSAEKEKVRALDVVDGHVPAAAIAIAHSKAIATRVTLEDQHGTFVAALGTRERDEERFDGEALEEFAVDVRLPYEGRRTLLELHGAPAALEAPKPSRKACVANEFRRSTRPSLSHVVARDSIGDARRSAFVERADELDDRALETSTPTPRVAADDSICRPPARQFDGRRTESLSQANERAKSRCARRSGIDLSRARTEEPSTSSRGAARRDGGSAGRISYASGCCPRPCRDETATRPRAWRKRSHREDVSESRSRDPSPVGR